jgi:bacillithiol biosynthesis cysteine-adding enzyme BshC
MQPAAAQPASVPAATGVVRQSIDVRKFSWIRPLVSAYSSDFASVAPLFSGNPADPAAWKDAIARVQKSPRDRAAIAKIVSQQQERRGAHAHARAVAARLADASSVAVVTGQQAGLFGGPLYTLLKAITAIQLARKVSAKHGVAAIPVFWVEAEDHDWEEVRTARVLDSELHLKSVSLGHLDGAGARPVSALTLDDSINAAIADLEGHLAKTEFTDELIGRLRQHYRPGIRMGEAFARWIDDLLGRHGLVVFEASDPAAKPLVADVFRRELEVPCHTACLAKETGEAMRALGHTPQVEPSEDSVALFYLGNGERQAIKRRDGGGYTIGTTAYDAAALQTEAVEHPERFSPNVLLRPVVQDRLFPTICYVAGPSELAYQAQLGAIYGAFGVEVPLLYPRANATLLDSAALRFLERSGLPLESLYAQGETTLNKLLESQLPPTLEPGLEELLRDMSGRIDGLKPVIAEVDPTLVAAAETTHERIQDTVKTLRNKIIQASKKKDETLRRQFTRTQALAFPAGEPQERIADLAFFVNRYGQAVVDRLLEALPLDMGQHYVLSL